MLKSEHPWPAIAAFLLAILFPVYWIYTLAVAGFEFPQGYFRNVMSLDLSDGVYLGLGFLEIYLYLNLRRLLHERSNYRGLDVVLFITIGNAAVFYIALFAIDLYLFLMGDAISISTQESLAGISLFTSNVCTFVYGLTSLVTGFLLIRNAERFPPALNIFSYLVVVSGLAQLTFIFQIATILLFPISVIALAVYFLQEPETLEII